MKTIVYLSLSLFLFFETLPTLQAQEVDEPQQVFVDNTWYLTKLIIEGEEFPFVPDSSLTDAILEVEEDYETEETQFSGEIHVTFCEIAYVLFELNHQDLYVSDWIVLAKNMKNGHQNCSWDYTDYEGDRADNYMYFEIFWDYAGGTYPYRHYQYVINQEETMKELIIVNDNGDEAHYQNVPYLSVDKNEISNLNIYPNPVQESFQIKNLTEKSHLKIYDLTGKEILQQEIHSSAENIDVSQLSSGLYFYGIFQDGKQVKTGKLIKE